MTSSEEEVVLLTIRVRLDGCFPGTPFYSLRRYPLTGGGGADRSADVGSVDQAVALVRDWLVDLTAGR